MGIQFPHDGGVLELIYRITYPNNKARRKKEIKEIKEFKEIKVVKVVRVLMHKKKNAKYIISILCVLVL